MVANPMAIAEEPKSIAASILRLDNIAGNLDALLVEM